MPKRTPASVKAPDLDGLEFARALLESAASAAGSTIAVVEFEIEMDVGAGEIGRRHILDELAAAWYRLIGDNGLERFVAGTRIRLVALDPVDSSTAHDRRSIGAESSLERSP